MRLSDSYILLENLKFHAYHGVLPQERRTGNDYRVSLRIKYDVTVALTSDDVDDTLNYAEIFELVSQEMQVPSALIERVGGRIGDRIFRRFPAVEEVKLTIVKENPPMGADCDGAGVDFLFVSDKLSDKLNK